MPDPRNIFFGVLGLSIFYILGQDYEFSSLSKIMLAILGIYCFMYLMLNKINDTFGIEGFEDPNKDYTVYKYCESKRRAACDEVLRPEKGNKKDN